MENEHSPYDIQKQEATQASNDLTARLLRESEEADFKWLMSNKRGRRIVWRLLDSAGVFRSSFSTVAMQMAYNEGYRNYGNRTLALLHEHCPELYPQMIKENTNGRDASRPNQ